MTSEDPRGEPRADTVRKQQAGIQTRASCHFAPQRYYVAHRPLTPFFPLVQRHCDSGHFLLRRKRVVKENHKWRSCTPMTQQGCTCLIISVRHTKYGEVSFIKSLIIAMTSNFSESPQPAMGMSQQATAILSLPCFSLARHPPLCRLEPSAIYRTICVNSAPFFLLFYLRNSQIPLNSNHKNRVAVGPPYPQSIFDHRCYCHATRSGG